MAGWSEKSAGIPVIEVGVPTKKDRGDLYVESLQKLDEQGLAPEQKINPNPKKEVSPELRKEINSHLSTAEKQSLEYLRLKALNVQTAIEKAKGPHNAERGVFVIEKKWKDTFSLMSFGQITEFYYTKKGGSENFSLRLSLKAHWHSIVIDNPEEMIRLVNFINFSKDFIKDNVQNISKKWENVAFAFYEDNGNILCGTGANMRGSVKILKPEHNFFSQFTEEVVEYLNYLYEEELENQKYDDKNRFSPFPPIPPK